MGGAVRSGDKKRKPPAVNPGSETARAAPEQAEASQPAALLSEGRSGGGGAVGGSSSGKESAPFAQGTASSSRQGAEEGETSGREGGGATAGGGRGGGADEIDAIFSEAKATKARKVEQAGAARDEQLEAGHGSAEGIPQESAAAKGRKRGARKTGPGASPAAGKGSSGKVRRKTEDGFTVYTEEELQWNKKNSGGTKLCPFDCDCCF